MIAPIRIAPLVRLGGALFALASTAAAQDWRVTISSHDALPTRTPTTIAIPPGRSLSAGDYRLTPTQGGPAQAAQVIATDGGSTLTVLLDPVAQSAPRIYRLEPLPKADRPTLQVKEEGPNLAIYVNRSDTPALFARHVSDFPDKPYLYPVIGPTGDPFTRAYPMEQVEGEDKDHPHQRSFWFTHGIVNGFDFWASDPINKPNPKFGTIRETARKHVVSGAVVARIHTTDDWLGPDGQKVCEDERILTFADAGPARLIDVDVILKATVGPVTFGDTKEGMFGLRVPSSMDAKRKGSGTITNAEGLHYPEVWGKPSPWVDYTGPVAGKVVGIAILNHPESFRYPTTWHVRDYGLFAANPFGWRDFKYKDDGTYTLPSGESIRFRYRVILHIGDTASADLPAAFRAFAEPPTITVAAE